MQDRKKVPIILLASVFLIATAVFPRFAHPEATITVVNQDGSGEGFNDTALPDADSATGGNTGATLGAQRLIAFQFAADIWGSVLDSDIEIRIGANFDPQSCSATQTVLGSAGTTTVHRNFDNAPVANTWYPAALANKLVGADLDTSTDDIGATFNSSVGTTCSFPNVWYYGLDATPPTGKIDFVTVVLHELGHGLGFQTFVDLVTGAKFLDKDDTFMLNLEDHSTGELYPDMTDAERVTASTATGDLHWVGQKVVADSVGLSAGRVQPSGHVEMYAPSTQEMGSSVSHFSTSLSPDESMEPSYTGVNHNVGLAEALMADIGWVSGDLVDVYFLVDLTDTFRDDLPVFKTDAPIIIRDLEDQGLDLKVGLGSFEDYPILPFGREGEGEVAYRRNIDLTTDTGAFITVINGLLVRSGNDLPESQLAALYQSASGAGQDLSEEGYHDAGILEGQQANFRDRAVKLILLWTDAPFHYSGDPGHKIPHPGPSFADTVDAILALDPLKVIGVSSGYHLETRADLEAIAAATNAIAPEGGVDCDGDGTIDVAGGEPLVCAHATEGDGVGDAMLAVIQAAVEPITVNIKVREPINLKSSKIAVAILGTGTDQYYAPDIDFTTVCFGAETTFGVGDCTESHGKDHIEDVNEDGLMDIVLHYDTAETGLTEGDTEACLTGKTVNGHGVEGCTNIRTKKHSSKKPKKPKKKK